MVIVIKKKCQNSNRYFYYHNGKIKTIKSDMGPLLENEKN
ncbi:hypothetical protein RS022_08870 [Candidatus Phytoplasma rubi]|uniref:Uncharacterized protein n=1 Tax=Candidatus Phytoplasma rubi TaxID=399025 RepID=A0ABY7BSU7_9MOLU|nr:hypothetical protein RS022_08870 [Candidatus Phytoplasma rubi]